MLYQLQMFLRVESYGRIMEIGEIERIRQNRVVAYFSSLSHLNLMS
jgi:hypothetical protein